MSRPFFSVIIAVFNGEQTIGRAIDSVLSQDWTDRELLVVDDGSLDATPEIVRRYGGEVRYIRQDNRGVSAARNSGADSARGDWLCFLDADDVYLPGRLRHYGEWIAEDNSLDFLTGDYEYRKYSDGSSIGLSMEKCPLGKHLLEVAGLNKRVVMQAESMGDYVEQHFGDTHTLTLPRSTFASIGGYPVGVPVCEDLSLVIRLCASSSKVGVVCEPLAVYFIREDSATRTNRLRAQQWTLSALIRIRDDEGHSLPSTLRAGLKRRIRRARMDLAMVLLRDGRGHEAFNAVMPGLWERPGTGSIRDILSVLRGWPGRPWKREGQSGRRGS